jgi:hypothetical protein
MTILAAGPTDSGAILHPDIVDTHRLDVGERTRNMAPYTNGVRPALRLADADPDSAVETGELPVWLPTWPEAEALQEPPILPPPMPLPSPPKVARPWFYRGRRRVRELRPAWAYLAVGAGLGSVATVVLQLAGIAALVVLR